MVDAIFIGYSLNSNTYRFLVIKSEINEISNDTIIESRDAVFLENIFPFKIKPNASDISFPSTSDASPIISNSSKDNDHII